MSLVYLITSLPRLVRHGPPPLPRAAFVARCRDILDGSDRAEFERLVEVETVEETIRLRLQAQIRELDADATTALQVGGRRDGVAANSLPYWLMVPESQHEMLRRHYFELTRTATTEFLRRWAHFRVDVGEVTTTLLCRAEGMGREAYLVQMEGSFDSSAPLIMAHWDEPDLGLGHRFPWMAAVAAAVADADLMAMTRALDDILWQRVEALQPIETFCIETVLAFYLQLRILEREASWDAAKGAAVLDAILARAAPPSTEARS